MIINNPSNMKKFSLLFAASLLLLASCDNSTPENPIQPDPVGTTYPRVQLIEHFTGEACGYCPGGMDQIYQVYSQNPDNYIWISNHTYGRDEYTIAESNTIANKLGVNSAPAVSLNRGRHSGVRNYHPYYLASYLKNEAATAATSISIEPAAYDPSTRELTITVLGKTAEQDLDSVLLTVAVTESGTIGPQSDYVSTWAGWNKFTHTHAARLFATAALGDVVRVSNRTFMAKYTVTLDNAWVADNCEVVAWITPGNFYYPVINAAKRPVVEGTKGGEDIVHGGIEEAPVPDSYPESGAPCVSTSLNSAVVYLVPFENSMCAMIEAINTDTVVGTYSGTPLNPFVVLYLHIPTDSTSAPLGTYNFVDVLSTQPGDAVAGYRDDEDHAVAASQLMYTLNDQGQLAYTKVWMLVSGTVVVTNDGFEVTATTKNGSPFHATYSGPLTPSGTSATPVRIFGRPEQSK